MSIASIAIYTALSTNRFKDSLQDQPDDVGTLSRSRTFQAQYTGRSLRKDFAMSRFSALALALMFAVAAALSAAPQANAQSPNPALLAPGHSGRMLASPRMSTIRSGYAAAGHRDVFRSRRGERLSHPSAHIH